MSMQQEHRRFFCHLGINEIDKHFVMFSEEDISWDMAKDCQAIQILLTQTQKRLLLCFDTNSLTKHDSLHTRRYLVELCQNFSNRVKILSFDLMTMFNDSDQEIYFPFFLLQQKLTLPDHQINQDKKYRWSFLSNRVRFHRLYFFQQIKHLITDLDCLAVHVATFAGMDRNFLNDHFQEYLGRIPEDPLADLPFISASARDSFADSFLLDPTDVDYSNANAAYLALFNVSGESSIEDDHVFLTEKTWKAVRSRCMVFSLGNPETKSYMEKLGFCLEHDKDLPIVDKISYIKNLWSLMDWQDSLEFYQKHQDQTEYNYHRFYSQDLCKIFNEYLRSRLQI